MDETQTIPPAGGDGGAAVPAPIPENAPETAAAGGAMTETLPPLAPWRLYLLALATFGIYALFWVGRTAADLRRHHDADVRVWRNVLGFMVPALNILIFYWLARRVADLCRSRGLKTRPPPGLITGLFTFIYLAGMFIGLVRQTPSGLYEFQELAATIIIWTLPLALVQRHMNGFKATLTDVAWIQPPGRFARGQRGALAFGVLVWSLIGVGIWADLARLGGTPLELGQQVTGTSGAYTLVVPQKGWVRAKEGRTGDEGMDLVLYGPTSETQVVVYVTPAAAVTLDRQVQARMELITRDGDLESFAEERTFLPGSRLPVSIARYQNQGPLGDARVYWSAAVIQDGRVIEVVGSSRDIAGQNLNLRLVAESLRLAGGEVLR